MDGDLGRARARNNHLHISLLDSIMGKDAAEKFTQNHLDIGGMLFSGLSKIGLVSDSHSGTNEHWSAAAGGSYAADRGLLGFDDLLRAEGGLLQRDFADLCRHGDSALVGEYGKK